MVERRVRHGRSARDDGRCVGGALDGVLEETPGGVRLAHPASIAAGSSRRHPGSGRRRRVRFITPVSLHLEEGDGGGPGQEADAYQGLRTAEDCDRAVGDVVAVAHRGEGDHREVDVVQRALGEAAADGSQLGPGVEEPVEEPEHPDLDHVGHDHHLCNG